MLSCVDTLEIRAFWRCPPSQQPVKHSHDWKLCNTQTKHSQFLTPLDWFTFLHTHNAVLVFEQKIETVRRGSVQTETESADQPSFQFGSLITDRRAITFNKAPTCWIRPLCICSCWNKAICEPFNPRNNNFSRDRQKSVLYQRHLGFFCERWNDGSEYDWGRNMTWTKTTLKFDRPNKDWCVTGNVVLIVK